LKLLILNYPSFDLPFEGGLPYRLIWMSLAQWLPQSFPFFLGGDAWKNIDLGLPSKEEKNLGA